METESYDDWTREKLIEHIKAYSAGLHELANLVMSQQYRIKKLTEAMDIKHVA